ncbi:glycosyl transferase [Candidatus Pacearchaeota archaeon]|nr:glycosyl transferase [Candidatus Pacearchaeota archaeon]
MKLSIIIPVYNEEKTIKAILKRVKAVPLELEKEIIIVDDSSKDSTKEILKTINDPQIKIFYHEVNKGKGSAIRTGLEQVTGDILLIQDADLEYSPEEYPKLLHPILNGTTKVVYGSRFKGNMVGPNLFSHVIGNKILTYITKILYFRNISDMETCYKVFKKEVIDSITLKAKRFDFEPEITAKIIKKGYKIYEVPITYESRLFDQGKKITWRDGIKALYYLIKYRIMD